MNSFVRQLNMYGFHKTKHNNFKSTFKHPMFQKGKEYFFNYLANFSHWLNANSRITKKINLPKLKRPNPSQPFSTLPKSHSKNSPISLLSHSKNTLISPTNSLGPPKWSTFHSKRSLLTISIVWRICRRQTIKTAPVSRTRSKITKKKNQTKGFWNSKMSLASSLPGSTSDLF